MIDGHHQFLRALRQSYLDLPIGPGSVNASLPLAVGQMLGAVFTLGVRLVAPIVIVLIVVEIGMALLARSAPMLNLNASAAPVRLIVGLVVLAVMVPAVASVVAATAGPMVRLSALLAGAFK
jgi:flagellar biosynthetic protein FliR